MPDFINACKLGDLEEGKGKCIKMSKDLEICLFKVGGTIYAIEEHCAHQGGPLSDGELKDFVITCPWHGMMYDIRTGKAAAGAWDQEYAQKSFNVKIEGNDVKVEI